jgi:hypothetical protein
MEAGASACTQPGDPARHRGRRQVLQAAKRARRKVTFRLICNAFTSWRLLIGRISLNFFTAAQAPSQCPVLTSLLVRLTSPPPRISCSVAEFQGHFGRESCDRSCSDSYITFYLKIQTLLRTQPISVVVINHLTIALPSRNIDSRSSS